MKKVIVGASGLYLAGMSVAGETLNEWRFKLDPPGATLAQAINSGTDGAVFASGGAGFLATDGAGGLLDTGNVVGSGGMWTDGALLAADVANAATGVRFLRYDFRYDLSDYRNDSGTVLGMTFIDGSGTNVAGVALALDKGASTPPQNLALTEIATDLAFTGTVSVIVKVDLDSQTMDVWYDLTGANNFNEASPNTANIPITLSSIDKLKFQATGDFRPTGSDDYANVENIRTASTWANIVTAPSLNKLAVHTLFHDHMVLQRDMNTPIWGRANPGAAITVKLDGVMIGTATTDGAGKWMARIDPQAHDGGVSHTLLVSTFDEPDLQINDVVFGDVYLASGQSNMYRSMANGILDYNAEVAAANYPLIRLVAMELNSTTAPLDEPVLHAGWQLCSSATVPDFSASAYFFARTLHLKTGVPVGILSAAWGGQKIDRFLSPEGVAAVPELSGMRLYQEQGGIVNFYDIYNAMIAPLIPYGMRGVIWYQGESNSSEADLYQHKMRALIRGWRQNWGQGGFPFYSVQLSTWETGIDWPGLRAAQLRSLSETNTGMVVSIDIGDDDPSNIHPHNKQDLGARLAQWALAKDLHYDIVYSGPLFRSAMVEGSQIRVLFDHAEGGLMIGSKDNLNPVVELLSEPLGNIEIAGADKIYVSATATIDADTIVVSSPSVPSPVYVRYDYLNVPAGSNQLYNAAGFPASPFYTDEAYRLDVTLGSGDNTKLVPGAQQIITADTAPSGKVFDRWVGAASEISALNSATATVTMPDHALYLLATYRPTATPAYTLTVNSGHGSGTSQAGSILNIEAGTPPTGQEFDQWTGSTQDVVNVSSSSTTLRMPAGNIAVTATYRMIDSVGDGIPDTWRATYFSGDGTSTNAQSAIDADPDGDGQTNGEEYRAGTSPTDAASVLKLADLQVGDDTIDVSFPTADGRR
ncbi:MAG: hypothetical protein K9M54_03320, partial [Kiritimatiellales bacterium]|nr:hypothetical protein [Kiritimatiellales bacterium]